MVPRFLKSLLKPRYAIEVGITRYGPAIEVHRKIFGLRIRASDKAFAREADKYVGQIQSWRVTKPKGRPAARDLNPRLVRHPAAIPTMPLTAGAKRLKAKVPVLDGGLAAAHLRRLAKPSPQRARSMPEVAATPKLPQLRRAQTWSPMLTDYDSPPSPTWAARCDAMAVKGTFANCPEVQVAAHMLDAKVRVFTANDSGGFNVGFVANPNGRRASLDLVLESEHYRWVPGGVDGDSFMRGSASDHNTANVPGDGDCLFHCFARGIKHAPKSVDTLRAGVVEHLRRCENAPLDGGGGGLTLGVGYAAAGA